MNKILFVLLFSLFVSGCTVQNSVNSRDNDLSDLAGEEQKKGDLIKTGTIIKTGEVFYLVETTGNKLEIDSYKYQLSDYEGKTHQVTGQFSGDTLFIGNIE